MSDDKNPGVPAKVLACDPRVRARALELVFQQLGMPDDGPPESLILTKDDPVELALELESPQLITRVRTASLEQLGESLSGGAIALVFEPERAWVVSPRRIFEVTARGERSERLRRARLAPVVDDATVMLLFERRLGLERLSVRETGTKNPWSRLRALVRLEARELWGMVAYATALGAFSLAVPLTGQVLVNSLSFTGLAQPIVVVSLALVVILGLSALVQVAEWYAVELLQRRLFVYVAEDFARRLLALPVEVHDRLSGQELINRFFEVVDLQKTVSRLLLGGLGLVLQTLVGLLLLAFYHPVLLAFDVVLVLCLIGVVAVGRGAVSSAIDESTAKYDTAAWLESLSTSSAVFKGADATLFAVHRADRLTRRYVDARKRHYRHVMRQLVGGVSVQALSLVTVLGVGSWLVMTGELTLGQLVAAELVVGLVGAGFGKIGKYLESAYDLLGSVDKLGKVLDLPVEKILASEAGASEFPGIELSSVRARPGLPRVSFVIPMGSRVRLTGASRAGKSSLMEVLAGLRAVCDGELRTPDAPVEKRHLRTWARLVTSNEVFDGNVLENLRLGRLSATESDVWDALTRVSLDERVRGIEGGLQAQIFAHGSPLSSSERRRLCLARTWLTRPSLLLIDGSLDDLGLDEDAARRVRDEFLGPSAPWTVVVVTADPEVAKYCKAVDLLDDLHTGGSDAP